MNKFVHNLDNTPVLVRDDVLPHLLSIFHPEQSQFPAQPECTLEFVLVLRSLVPNFPESLFSVPHNPLHLLVPLVLPCCFRNPQKISPLRLIN